MRSISRERVLEAFKFFGIENLPERFHISKPYEQVKADWDQLKAELKKQYRKMCFDHHPDRGGDVSRLQEINSHYEIIEVMEMRPPQRPQPVMMVVHFSGTSGTTTVSTGYSYKGW